MEVSEREEIEEQGEDGGRRDIGPDIYSNVYTVGGTDSCLGTKGDIGYHKGKFP